VINDYRIYRSSLRTQSSQCCCTVDDSKLVVPKPLPGYPMIENTIPN